MTKVVDNRKCHFKNRKILDNIDVFMIRLDKKKFQKIIKN